MATREERLRAYAAGEGWPPPKGVEAAVLILRYLEEHEGAFTAFDTTRNDDIEAFRRLHASINVWSDGRLADLVGPWDTDPFSLLLGVAARFYQDYDLVGGP